MPILTPSIVATVGVVAYQYGYLTQWPIAYYTAAKDWKNESETAFDGRFHPSNGVLHSTAIPKRQDTFLSGTSGRTGRAFSANSGIWKDDVVDPQYGKYGLFQVDGTSAAPVAEVVSATTTTKIEHALLVLHRDFPASGSAPVAGWRTGYSTYLHLAYNSPDKLDYRFCYESGQPPRIDFTNDGGTTWRAVAVASNVGDSDTFLKLNRNEVRINVVPDHDDVRFEIELGHGNYLRTANGPMPSTGNIRLLSAGGSVRFWYYPLRYQPLKLDKSPKDFQVDLKNLDQAQVLVNGKTTTPSDQTTTPTVTTPDGRSLKVSVIAQRPDSGDTLGSTTPAKLDSITVYIPPVFDASVPGGTPSPNTTSLRMMRVEQMQIFDLVSRTASYAANLVCSNLYGDYDGVYGRYACALDASNGDGFSRQCTGIIGDGEGFHVYRQDPIRLLYATLLDKTCMLQRGLGQEIDFDGWPWPAVVRFVANAGNIADDFLTTIPYAPPGPATADSPFQSLGRGSGLNAAYRYYPTQTCWSILCELVMQLSVPDPTSGLPIAFYHGFDNFGQYHFEPVSFVGKQSSAFYSSRAAQTGGIPITDFHKFESVADMRSSIDLLGIDANTFEALYLHLPLSPGVLAAVGYTMPLIQHSPTFVSDDYMNYLAYAMSIQSSIPQETLRLNVPFVPTVAPGALVDVWLEEIGGLGQYVVERQFDKYGIQDVGGQSGDMDCYSILDLRNVLNTL